MDESVPNWPLRRISGLSWTLLAVLLWGATALIFLGQLLIFRNTPDTQAAPGYVIMLAGLIGFVITTRRMNLAEASEPPAPDAASAASAASPAWTRLGFRFRYPWLIIALGSASFAALSTAQRPPQASLWDYFGAWGVCLVALVMSVQNNPRIEADDRTGSLTRWDYLLLVALFVGALLIRGIAINSVPHILDDNEAIFALRGAEIRLTANWIVSPFWPGYHSYPLLHSSLIAISTALLGLTPAGARIPSVLFGALGIPAIYLLGRELFGWRTGLVSALFALAWAYHVQFSRLALNQFGDPLFATLAFYFLLRGLRRGAALDYVLSGIMLGLSQMFYLGGRVHPLVMLAYLAFIGLRQRALIQRQWRLILLVPFAALVVTLPQNYYLLVTHTPFTEHTDPSLMLNGGLIPAITSPDFFTAQVLPAITGLFSTPDRTPWYGPSSNLMGLFGGPLLLIGIAVSLFTLWRHPRRSLPLGWLAATVIGGSMLSMEPPQYQRYFPAVPALALLAGLGITALSAATVKLLRYREYRTGLALSLGALVCVANLAFYVAIYVPEARYLGKRAGWVNDRLARDMLSASEAGQQIVLVSDYPWGVNDSNVVRYTMIGRPYTILAGPADPGLDHVPGHGPFMFYVPPEDKDSLEMIKNRFPGGSVQEIYLDFMNEDGSLAFYTYVAGSANPN